MVYNYENGQIHVTDTGEALAIVDEAELPNLRPVPVEIDIFIDGYWYTYSLTERTKEEGVTENDLQNL